MSVAFELSVSLHSDECGCRDAGDYRGFEAAVKRAHPDAWAWAKDKHFNDDTPYIDARNKLGRNPKRDPNPDAVPRSRQRDLNRSERLEHKRHRTRWGFADKRIIEDGDASLVASYARGARMSPSQAALFAVIADGWIRCSIPINGRYHVTHPDNAVFVAGHPVCPADHPNC